MILISIVYRFNDLKYEVIYFLVLFLGVLIVMC